MTEDNGHDFLHVAVTKGRPHLTHQTVPQFASIYHSAMHGKLSTLARHITRRKAHSAVGHRNRMSALRAITVRSDLEAATSKPAAAAKPKLMRASPKQPAAPKGAEGKAARGTRMDPRGCPQTLGCLTPLPDVLSRAR